MQRESLTTVFVEKYLKFILEGLPVIHRFSTAGQYFNVDSLSFGERLESKFEKFCSNYNEEKKPAILEVQMILLCHELDVFP